MPELRDWKPEGRSFCPPPSWRFLGEEAAVAWGYPTMTAWKNEAIIERGEVIAWYLEKNLREGYEREKQEKKAKADAEKKGKNKGNNNAFRYSSDLLRARAAAAKVAGS